MRFRQSILALASCAACAGAPVRDDAELLELKGQVAAQSAQLAAQQRRIEELEVKLAALAARGDSKHAAGAAQTDKAGHGAAPIAAPVAAPAHDPRPKLKTVKLGEGRRRRRDYNPVERAPLIPSSISLKEPDQETLDRLDAAAVDPAIRAELDADHSFAQAVAKLNRGDLQAAEQELLAFAGEHPRHTAADNALYLAGLVREVRGDCAGALQLFESVPLKYPAGDAVPSAQLERGRCLRILGRNGEAKSVLDQLALEHPHAAETAQSRQLLQGL